MCAGLRLARVLYYTGVSDTGFLIILLGLGLSLTNWLSLLVIMGCALLGVSYRIHIEEHVLQAQLGVHAAHEMAHPLYAVTQDKPLHEVSMDAPGESTTGTLYRNGHFHSVPPIMQVDVFQEDQVCEGKQPVWREAVT